MTRTTLNITDPMPAPHWALLQRQLLDLTLVNLDPARSCSMVVQAGTYSEHQFVNAGTAGETHPVGNSAIDVNLDPGAGARILFTLERFTARPTLEFPWRSP